MKLKISDHINHSKQFHNKIDQLKKTFCNQAFSISKVVLKFQINFTNKLTNTSNFKNY